MRLAQKDWSSWKASRWRPLCEVAGTARAKEEALGNSGFVWGLPSFRRQSLVLRGGVGGGKRRAERGRPLREVGGASESCPWGLGDCCSRTLGLLHVWAEIPTHSSHI